MADTWQWDPHTRLFFISPISLFLPLLFLSLPPGSCPFSSPPPRPFPVAASTPRTTELGVSSETKTPRLPSLPSSRAALLSVPSPPISATRQDGSMAMLGIIERESRESQTSRRHSSAARGPRPPAVLRALARTVVGLVVGVPDGCLAAPGVVAQGQRRPLPPGHQGHRAPNKLRLDVLQACFEKPAF